MVLIPGKKSRWITGHVQLSAKADQLELKKTVRRSLRLLARLHLCVAASWHLIFLRGSLAHIYLHITEPKPWPAARHANEDFDFAVA